MGKSADKEAIKDGYDADESNLKSTGKSAESPTLVRPSNSSGKRYQAQIESLKILKGTGLQNPEPCKKLNGFLSIEQADNVTFVIFRSLTGREFFKGILT